MNTNRPHPFKKVLREFDGISDIMYSALLYEYFSDIPGGLTQAGRRTWHGMETAHLRADNQWETVLDLQGPGMCNFLGFAARNNSMTQGYAYSMRAYVDGSLIHERNYWSVTSSEPQSALCLIGNVFTDRGASGKLRAAAGSLCPFNRSIVFQAISENVTQLPLVVVYRAFATR